MRRTGKHLVLSKPEDHLLGTFKHFVVHIGMNAHLVERHENSSIHRVLNNECVCKVGVVDIEVW